MDEHGDHYQTSSTLHYITNELFIITNLEEEKRAKMNSYFMPVFTPAHFVYSEGPEEIKLRLVLYGHWDWHLATL